MAPRREGLRPRTREVLRMTYIGIVGAEGTKFSPQGEAAAKALIRRLLAPDRTILVSGHCPKGGVDIWAEEIAKELGRKTRIHPPKVNNWNQGYKPRNMKIANDSEILHNITVANYPEGWTRFRFTWCYHCRVTTHVPSGGCWTMKRVADLDRPTHLHIVLNRP
jgi:hypothetical protein